MWQQVLVAQTEVTQLLWHRLQFTLRYERSVQTERGNQRVSQFNRRNFIRTLSAAITAPRFIGRPSGIFAPSNNLLFEEIPAAVSGISWNHVNGRSSE